MYLLRLQFSITDLLVLQLMAIVLGVVAYFALLNRRKLQAIIDESNRRTSLTGSGSRYPIEGSVKPGTDAKKGWYSAGLSLPFTKVKAQKQTAYYDDVAVMPGGLHELKQSIRQQQKTLDHLLTRVDKMHGTEEREGSDTGHMARVLEEKESELQKTKQQLSSVQKVAGRVTEVYEEFDHLQQKMAELEEGASKAAELAMELDEVQQAFMQLKKEFSRKQEKLHESVTENSQLHQRLSETEDKLTEANLQRQQLQKKVQMLENINTELQQMSDANKKMKAELRRVAELESLLSLVSDERDLLLKKRLS